MKWAMELSEVDINYKAMTEVKGQESVDFIVEFTEASNINIIMEPLDPRLGACLWIFL